MRPCCIFHVSGKKLINGSVLRFICLRGTGNFNQLLMLFIVKQPRSAVFSHMISQHVWEWVEMMFHATSDEEPKMSFKKNPQQQLIWRHVCRCFIFAEFPEFSTLLGLSTRGFLFCKPIFDCFQGVLDCFQPSKVTLILPLGLYAQLKNSQLPSKRFRPCKKIENKITDVCCLVAVHHFL